MVSVVPQGTSGNTSNFSVFFLASQLLASAKRSTFLFSSLTFVTASVPSMMESLVVSVQNWVMEALFFWQFQSHQMKTQTTSLGSFSSAPFMESILTVPCSPTEVTSSLRPVSWSPGQISNSISCIVFSISKETFGTSSPL